MPCTTQPNLTEQARANQRAAIARLDQGLASGAVSAVIGASGSIAFRGWNDRADVSDLCAYRALAASNSPALRLAIVRAEARAGRQLDRRAVAAGVHSHDDGGHWHPGH